MKTLRLTGLIAASLVPGIAQAQPGEAPPVPVEEAEQDAEREDGDPIIVTATGLSTASSATKLETPIIETPQTISIISRAEMDARAVSSVADALSYVAGVQAQSQGVDSRVDDVTVRGFGAGGFSSNNNFLDGLRLPTGGMWTRLSFDPFTLQQVEVLKGPSSVLYGQTAPGGIVNLVSRRPSFTPRAELQLQGIGFTELGNARFQAAADISGPLGSSVAGRLVAVSSHGGNQPDGVDNSRYVIAPSLTARLGPSTNWTVMAQYQRDEGGATFQFLPAGGTLRETNGRRMDLEAFIGEPGWNQFDRDQYMLASFFEHRFGENFAIRNNSRFTKADTLYRAVVLAADTLVTCPEATIPGCIPGQTIRRRAVQGVGETDGFITDTQLEARFDTGPVEHILLGGVDYFWTDWQHLRDGVPDALVLPLLDIFNPVPRGSAGFEAALAPAANQYIETTSDQIGVYLQEQLSWGGLRLAIGGRYDWATDDVTVLATPSNPRREYLVKSDAFTWNAGAVYLFDFGLAPYASYAESFLPLQNSPTTNFTGEPFQPTTGRQIEAGLRYQPPGSNIYVTLSAFEIVEQNRLVPDPVNMSCGGSPCQVQTGESRTRGLELEGRASLSNGLSLVGTLTYLDAEITESTTASQVGKVLPQVPDLQASLFADYRFLDGPLRGLGLGGGVRHVGESFGDLNNTLAIPDYTVFDFFLRYDIRAGDRPDGITLSLNARNAFNEQFVATCTAPQACYWGAGRQVTARVQYRF